MSGKCEVRCEACGLRSPILASYRAAVTWINRHWAGCKFVLDCGYCRKGHSNFATLAAHVQNECIKNPYRKVTENAKRITESERASGNEGENWNAPGTARGYL